MSDGVTELSLCQAADAIRQGKLSSLEVTEACLERIDRLQPDLNCFIAVDRERARSEARAADSDCASGRIRGPLHGVPMAHKDMFFDESRIPTCGSMHHDRQPVQSVQSAASVLLHLRAAGALNLGALNLDEFGLGTSGDNEHFGRCRNPWNRGFVSGGSSSGAACAVAARLVFGALGTDAGGSIRIPASACGVVGLKPTYGRVSRHGVVSHSFTLDHVGPIARTVRDCARLTAIIAGRDVQDPESIDAPVSDYESGLDRSVRGIRMGVVDGFEDDVSEDVRKRLDESRRSYRGLGVTTVRLEMPKIDDLMAFCQIISRAEVARLHWTRMRAHPERYGQESRHRIALGYAIPAVHYIEACARRRAILDGFCRDVFRTVDLLHLPILGRPVPSIAEAERMEEDPQSLMELARNTRIFNYLGLPSLSVPCGFDHRHMPVAHQLVGRPFAEGLVLRLGHAYQCMTDWHEVRPRNAGPSSDHG